LVYAQRLRIVPKTATIEKEHFAGFFSFFAKNDFLQQARKIFICFFCDSPDFSLFLCRRDEDRAALLPELE